MRGVHRYHYHLDANDLEGSELFAGCVLKITLLSKGDQYIVCLFPFMNQGYFLLPKG